MGNILGVLYNNTNRRNSILSGLFMSLLLPPKKSLCAYRTLFGEPTKGVHSYRFFNIAIVDVIAKIGSAIVI